MYGRLLELIEKEESKDRRSRPWGEAELGILRGMELGQRVESALAIEAKCGKGCLLNLEDP